MTTLTFSNKTNYVTRDPDAGRRVFLNMVRTYHRAVELEDEAPDVELSMVGYYARLKLNVEAGYFLGCLDGLMGAW
jgi:hypothetical protein